VNLLSIESMLIMNSQKKYIFITGGVLSGIGKGISAASIGMLMEHQGIQVNFVKMDPYINVDPGTMNPFQHGEVFVLEDGAETDLDLGHYFRFVQNACFTRKNSFTAGWIYHSVIQREREGKYLGETVQVIPHITDAIKEHIQNAALEADLTIVEVGGTVGDIESLPFLEAIRQMRVEVGKHNAVFIHVTLVPLLGQELKTKPTQHSVKALRSIGIQPDFLICRSSQKLSLEIKKKIGLFCNVSENQVFSAIDVKNIYEVPLHFHEEGLDQKIGEALSLCFFPPQLSKWTKMVEKINHPQARLKIGIVGKYSDWQESYKSLFEALVHSGVTHQLKVDVQYIESTKLEHQDFDLLKTIDGIIIPGGFGNRGIEEKIKVIRYAREKKIPFLGICLGMQLAIIEFARTVCGLTHANSAEFMPNSPEKVIDLLENQKNIFQKGGTMRLGAYRCQIDPEVQGKPTKAYLAYQKTQSYERHRHRFEVSPLFIDQLKNHGLVVSGKWIDPATHIELVEMIELPDHPWFLGCQFHPEFLSRPLQSHSLFDAFLQAAMKFQTSHLISETQMES